MESYSNGCFHRCPQGLGSSSCGSPARESGLWFAEVLNFHNLQIKATRTSPEIIKEYKIGSLLGKSDAGTSGLAPQVIEHWWLSFLCFSSCTWKGGDDIRYQAASLTLGKNWNVTEKPTKNHSIIKSPNFWGLVVHPECTAKCSLPLYKPQRLMFK